MRFFDYKFLILLGLTLVVYFIYREVEYLRSKVNKIEADLNQKKLISNEPILIEPKINAEIVSKPMNNIIHQSKSPEKVINLDLVSQSIPIIQNTMQFPGIKINNTILKVSSVTSDNLDTDNENNVTTTELESESESESELESESSKHLAIYSNDNEQFDSAQNSLIESVEANKINVENPDLKSTMDNIINELSSENESEKSNKSKQQEIDEIIIEKEKQLSEMSPKSEQNKQLTEIELNKKKLVDIKEIAVKLNITISKKVNGQQRLKTKQDLINEILQK